MKEQSWNEWAVSSVTERATRIALARPWPARTDSDLAGDRQRADVATLAGWVNGASQAGRIWPDCRRLRVRPGLCRGSAQISCRKR